MSDVSSEAPEGLESAGLRLWLAVTEEYELEEHELQLLEQAARTADLVARLHSAISDGELTEVGPHGGTRVRPEVVEIRQQRIVLARLLAALRVPLGAEEESTDHNPTPRLQRRSGARGVYGVAGGAR